MTNLTQMAAKMDLLIETQITSLPGIMSDTGLYRDNTQGNII